MKCPKCGKELKEGALFCDRCFTEIKIVPEYETQLEQKLSESMSSISKDIKEDTDGENAQKTKSTETASQNPDDSEADRQQLSLKKRHKRRLFAAGTASAAAVLLVIFIQRSQPSYYIGRAYDLASGDQYTAASEMIDRALKHTDEDSEERIDLYLTKADYLRKAGEYDDALQAAQLAEKCSAYTNENMPDVYSRIFSILSDQNRYDVIAQMLTECKNEELRRAYQQFLAEAPEFSQKPGSYDGQLELQITDEGIGSIFYTLDGSVPTADSPKYMGSILLKDGTFNIKAVFINRFGVQSDILSGSFEVASDQPAAPNVTPESGEYTSSAYITAKASVEDKDAKIYYTTDGTEPDESSNEYTGPIKMPIGASHYSFVVIGTNGEASDIVERDFTLTTGGKIKAEDGPNYILVALIGRGEVIDTIGTIPGGSAVYSYQYVGAKEISGHGSFLIYNETLTDSEGNSASTGRIFAVNISNGTVNLYDSSSGTLTPMNQS